LQVIRWDLRTGDRTVVVPAADEVHKVMMPAVSKRGDVAYPPTIASPDIVLVRSDGTRTTLRGHADKVAGGGFSADGTALYSASWDGTVRRWDVATGIGEVILRGDPIQVMLMAPVGDRFLVGYDGRFALHGPDGQQLHELRGANISSSSVWGKKQFSPDGKSVVIASKDGRAVHWVPETGAVIGLEGIGHHATHVAFSPDGRFLAGAMQDRTVRIWHLETGKLSGTFEGHVDLVMNVAYSPDGKQLASSSYDRTVRVWDIDTGQSRVLRGHAGAVETLAWLDNGHRLVTGSRDATLRIWPSPSTATPTPEALRGMIDRATSAEVGAGEKLATPLAR
jgi:WD40 repeat protein